MVPLKAERTALARVDRAGESVTIVPSLPVTVAVWSWTVPPVVSRPWASTCAPFTMPVTWVAWICVPEVIVSESAFNVAPFTVNVACVVCSVPSGVTSSVCACAGAPNT